MFLRYLCNLLVDKQYFKMNKTALLLLVVLAMWHGPAHGNDGHVHDAIPANAINGQDDRACICSGTFSRSVDYFPDKLDNSAANGFQVSYHNYYKVINNTAVTPPVVHVGYQCGAPAPTNAILGFTPDAIIELPVKRIGVLSTTDVPWVEFLGDRMAITAGPGRSYLSSPCLGKLMDSGAVLDASSSNKTALDLAQVDVTFTSAGWGWSNDKNKLSAAPTATPAPIGANLERKSVLAVVA